MVIGVETHHLETRRSQKPGDVVLDSSLVAGDGGNGYQISDIGNDPIGLNDWVHCIRPIR